MAEAERDERVRSARTAERTRIAREMHDVLAHRISQISLHAGALGFREDLDADTMRAGVRQIQGNAHQALTELRDVLGVLRDQEGATPPDRPQPTYGDLRALVAEARAAGTCVDFTDQTGDDVPDHLGRTLYRVAQEGLTNARKHAPGSVVSLDVRGGPSHGIELWVRNAVVAATTPTPGAELGLIGLRERVDLTGGRLEAGVVGEDHVLHVWLPWKAPS
jgi:signal transduction histidine kinase